MGTYKIAFLKLAIVVSLLPYLWLFTQSSILGGVIPATANIVGFLAAVLMLWQFILGIRFVSSQFSEDYVSVISLHKNLGKYGGVLALIHPFWQMINYGSGLEFFYQLDLFTEFGRHLSLGRMAFYLFLVIWISSAILRSKIAFRPWLYIHYLVYPMMGFVFLHALDIGSFLTAFPVIQGYWFFMGILFFFVVSYRGLFTINLLKYQYTLTKKTQLGNITTYTFSPCNNALVSHVGQFAYLSRGLLHEAHPFTILKRNEMTGDLTFAIKTEGRFTKNLKSMRIGDILYIDGPYGVFTREGQSSEPKVIIAGGIGITPFVELVEKHGNEKTYLFYSNRKVSEGISQKELKQQLGSRFVEAITQEPTAEVTIKGRLSKSILVSHLDKSLIAEARFFVCGSPSFMKSMISILRELGIPQKRVFKEEFSL